MHVIERINIEDFNKQLVLSRAEELNLSVYDIREDSNGDLMVVITDPKISTSAYLAINLSSGSIEEMDTGAVEGDFIYELCNYSHRINQLSLIEKEMQYGRTGS